MKLSGKLISTSFLSPAFIPTIASPAKVAQIRGYRADLVVGGDRYADALAASEAWIAQSGALPIHAYDQVETLRGQGTVGLELEAQAPDLWWENQEARG